MILVNLLRIIESLNNFSRLSLLLQPNGFSHKTKQELLAKGYFLVEKETRVIGKVNAILIDSKKGLQAGPDPRGDEAAASY